MVGVPGTGGGGLGTETPRTGTGGGGAGTEAVGTGTGGGDVGTEAVGTGTGGGGRLGTVAAGGVSTVTGSGTAGSCVTVSLVVVTALRTRCGSRARRLDCSLARGLD
jgi:hypothetical protein